MDVTIENFEQILNEFQDVIEWATFFSIDSEFTGLLSERKAVYSTPSEFYKRIHQGVDEYIIIQLGITAFHINKDSPQKVEYKSFNFYVFPKNDDQSFKCSGSSMSFLAEQKFNFNRLFYSGLSCCTRDEAIKLRTKYEERKKNREEALEMKIEHVTNVDEVTVPLEELNKMAEVRTKIQTFLKQSADKTIVFGNCNAFQRKLIYQLVQKEFHDSVTATSQMVNNQKVIVVEQKWSTERQQKEVEQQNIDEEKAYRQLVGLSEILFQISQSKKIIVGHNMFMDLYYLVRQFFEPLSDTLKIFKKQVHRIFPNLIDTKHLCYREKITNSVLKNVFDMVSLETNNLPLIEASKPEFGYVNGKEHEAGYDSYITGVCFLGLIKKMNIKYEDISTKCPQIRPLLNKISVMNLIDIFFIDLTGTEPKPDRDHVFHVTFPKTWTENDLRNHFKKFGPLDRIRWINKCSAFVPLKYRENAPILLKAIGFTKGVQIKTFSMYIKTNGIDEADENDAETSTAPKRTIADTSNSSPAKKTKLTHTNESKFVNEEAWPEETF